MEDEPYYTSSLHGGSLLSSPGGLAPGSSVYSEDHRGRDLTKDQLAESRREARERYLQKQKQEDALAEANFKAERELQDAIKKQMDEKAKKLQEITTERVAKYKVCVLARSCCYCFCNVLVFLTPFIAQAMKREQARKEKEAKEQALALKKEKDREAQSEEYIAKMNARMLETEQRYCCC